MTENIAAFSERFGRRIKTAVEDVEKTSESLPSDNKATILAGYSSPVEITDSWTQDGDVWKCRARRLYRRGGSYQPINDGVEFDLYFPTSAEPPELGIGDRVFAVFRGVWEVVSGVAGGESAPRKAVLVQPKELFPACEYKTPTEHYIIAPGGRDANKQTIPFIYSLDLAAEKWMATTFPAMHEPMFNMDAKIVELADGTHQLIILSGQSGHRFPCIIQGYNFEKDFIKAPIDLGELGINFAGRPALVGDPMLRNVGTTVILPDEETNFLRSLMVIGGGERSVAATPGGLGNSTLDSVLFSVRGETLAIGSPYRIQTQNMAISNIGHTGLPFGRFEYKSYVGSTNDVITRLQRIGTYARHQNLPVRGILRRRPLLPNGNTDTSAPSSSKPVVDFLLIGGFNEGVDKEERNKSVVSGFFNAMTWSASSMRTQTFYTMAIKDVTNVWDNLADRFLHYPDCKHVLGDCCAEYLDDSDEILCFGGRAVENDTAPAHKELAVLKFDALPSQSATWLYSESEHGYPPLPHPRWSAASVLIKDLVRTGETEPCTRIFIIGGRDKDGFVAEVDVLNLKTKKWETDWAGLDSGELEDIPASLGGSGTTIIIGGGGGGDGVQSVKAGGGINVSGERKNPVVAATGFIWGGDFE
ncbi:MAG: kelch motif-containing protein [Planctomycetaceae bacterium]|nr:kelch motif-containing protein [Planctomycetaceae bacterium]